MDQDDDVENETVSTISRKLDLCQLDINNIRDVVYGNPKSGKDQKVIDPVKLFRSELEELRLITRRIELRQATENLLFPHVQELQRQQLLLLKERSVGGSKVRHLELDPPVPGMVLMVNELSAKLIKAESVIAENSSVCTQLLDRISTLEKKVRTLESGPPRRSSIRSIPDTSRMTDSMKKPPKVKHVKHDKKTPALPKTPERPSTPVSVPQAVTPPPEPVTVLEAVTPVKLSPPSPELALPAPDPPIYSARRPTIKRSNSTMPLIDPKHMNDPIEGNAFMNALRVATVPVTPSSSIDGPSPIAATKVNGGGNTSTKKFFGEAGDYDPSDKKEEKLSSRGRGEKLSFAPVEEDDVLVLSISATVAEARPTSYGLNYDEKSSPAATATATAKQRQASFDDEKSLIADADKSVASDSSFFVDQYKYKAAAAAADNNMSVASSSTVDNNNMSSAQQQLDNCSAAEASRRTRSSMRALNELSHEADGDDGKYLDDDDDNDDSDEEDDDGDDDQDYYDDEDEEEEEEEVDRRNRKKSKGGRAGKSIISGGGGRRIPGSARSGDMSNRVSNSDVYELQETVERIKVEMEKMYRQIVITKSSARRSKELQLSSGFVTVIKVINRWHRASELLSITRWKEFVQKEKDREMRARAEMLKVKAGVLYERLASIDWMRDIKWNRFQRLKERTEYLRRGEKITPLFSILMRAWYTKVKPGKARSWQHWRRVTILRRFGYNTLDDAAKLCAEAEVGSFAVTVETAKTQELIKDSRHDEALQIASLASLLKGVTSRVFRNEEGLLNTNELIRVLRKDLEKYQEETYILIKTTEQKLTDALSNYKQQVTVQFEKVNEKQDKDRRLFQGQIAEQNARLYNVEAKVRMIDDKRIAVENRLERMLTLQGDLIIRTETLEIQQKEAARGKLLMDEAIRQAGDMAHRAMDKIVVSEQKRLEVTTQVNAELKALHQSDKQAAEHRAKIDEALVARLEGEKSADLRISIAERVLRYAVPPLPTPVELYNICSDFEDKVIRQYAEGRQAILLSREMGEQLAKFSNRLATYIATTVDQDILRAMILEPSPAGGPGGAGIHGWTGPAVEIVNDTIRKREAMIAEFQGNFVKILKEKDPQPGLPRSQARVAFNRVFLASLNLVLSKHDAMVAERVTAMGKAGKSGGSGGGNPFTGSSNPFTGSSQSLLMSGGGGTGTGNNRPATAGTAGGPRNNSMLILGGNGNGNNTAGTSSSSLDASCMACNRPLRELPTNKRKPFVDTSHLATIFANDILVPDKKVFGLASKMIKITPTDVAHAVQSNTEFLMETLTEEYNNDADTNKNNAFVPTKERMLSTTSPTAEGGGARGSGPESSSSSPKTVTATATTAYMAAATTTTTYTTTAATHAEDLMQQQQPSSTTSTGNDVPAQKPSWKRRVSFHHTNDYSSAHHKLDDSSLEEDASIAVSLDHSLLDIDEDDDQGKDEGGTTRQRDGPPMTIPNKEDGTVGEEEEEDGDQAHRHLKDKSSSNPRPQSANAALSNSNKSKRPTSAARHRTALQEAAAATYSGSNPNPVNHNAHTSVVIPRHGVPISKDEFVMKAGFKMPSSSAQQESPLMRDEGIENIKMQFAVGADPTVTGDVVTRTTGVHPQLDPDPEREAIGEMLDDVRTERFIDGQKKLLNDRRRW